MLRVLSQNGSKLSTFFILFQNHNHLLKNAYEE